MSIRINGDDIETESIEWGVLFEHDENYDTDLYLADDETDARQVLSLTVDGQLVARKVYETAWAEVTQ